jgi:hypothetical protein
VSDLDDIRQQMAQIRFNLHTDVTGVISETERMFDWRRYIRNAPWLWSAVALGAGYLLVPKRRPATPTVHQVATHVVDHLPMVQAAFTPPAPKSSGVFGLTPGRMAWWAIKSASPMVLAAAQSYALPFVEQWIAQRLQPQGPRPSPRPSGPDPSGRGGGGGGYGAQSGASPRGDRRF